MHFFCPSGQTHVDIVNSNATAFVDLNAKDITVINGHVKTDQTNIVFSNLAGNAYKPVCASDFKIDGVGSMRPIAGGFSLGISGATVTGYVSKQGNIIVTSLKIEHSSGFSIQNGTSLGIMNANFRPYTSHICTALAWTSSGYVPIEVTFGTDDDYGSVTVLTDRTSAFTVNRITISAAFMR